MGYSPKSFSVLEVSCWFHQGIVRYAGSVSVNWEEESQECIETGRVLAGSTTETFER